MISEILFNSYKMLFENHRAYIQIQLPYICLSVFLIFTPSSTITTILEFALIYLMIDVQVKIIRFNILDERSYYKFVIVRNLKYFIYGVLVSLLFCLCVLPSMLGLALAFGHEVGRNTTLIFVSAITLGGVWTIILCAYMIPILFIFPILATGNEFKLKKIIKYGKGYRLIFTLQLLIFMMISYVFYHVLILIPGNGYEELLLGRGTIYGEIFILIMGCILSPYSINLLTETFKSWNKKYNLYNF